MNDVMSLGIHRLWKRQFVDRLSIRPNGTYADIAAGTGDITRLLYKKISRHGFTPNIVAIDPNQTMLEQGKIKLINQGIIKGITWADAAAEALPFEEGSFDAITIAFGLRNTTDFAATIQECYRVLKPGGQFLCLEFSHVKGKALDSLYQMYSTYFIPKLGKLIANDQQSYEYLVSSIQQFPDQDTLKEKLETAGFQHVNYDNLTGGIVAIHEGWK